MTRLTETRLAGSAIYGVAAVSPALQSRTGTFGLGQGLLTSPGGSHANSIADAIATLSLLLGGLACAKNSANEDVGAARDTTRLDTIAPSTTVRRHGLRA